MRPLRGTAVQLAVAVLFGAGLFAVAMRPDGAAAGVDQAAWVVSAQASNGDGGDDGAAVYGRRCAPCHGPAGEGATGPSLVGLVDTATDRAEVITNGRNAMPAFGTTLADAQIAALVEFLDGMRAEPAYAQLCAPCHGPSGEGTSVASPIPGPAERRPDAAAVVLGGGDAMPAFGHLLTDSQVDDLFAYLDGLVAEAPNGAALADLYATRCATCHGAFGEGGSGPALGAGERSRDDQVAVITIGTASMPGFGSDLSTAEIEALVDYLATLGAAEAGPAGNGGFEIFSERCAVCHGPDGTGGSGPAVVGGALTAEEVAAVVLDGPASMPSFENRLTPAEIEAVAAFVAGTDGGGQATPSIDDDLVTLGAGLYETACAACHGADATGGSGPSLQMPASDASDEELTAIITAGLGTMPAITSLSATDVEAIIAHLRLLAESGAEQGSAGEGEVADVEGVAVAAVSGRETFIQVCAVCHGTEGEGGAGPPLYGTSLTVNEVISQVYGGHTADMPAFQGVIDSTHIQAVARFVSSLPVPRGAEAADVVARAEEAARIDWWPGLLAAAVLAVAAWLVLRRYRRRRNRRRSENASLERTASGRDA